MDSSDDEMKEMGYSIEELVSGTAETVTTIVDTTADKVVSRLKEIDTELKRLRKESPETDEELKEIQARMKALREERKTLLGNPTTKREAGTYGVDSLDEATAEADQLHLKNVLSNNSLKGQLSEYDLIIKKNAEVIRYSKDLVAALDKLKSETDETHIQTLDKIKKRLGEIALEVQEAQVNIDQAVIAKQRQSHKDKLELLQASYEQQKLVIDRNVKDGKIQQAAADVYMMSQERKLHQDQLDELNRYYKEVEVSDRLGSQEKTKTLNELDGQIRNMTAKTLVDAAKWSEKLREMANNTSGVKGLEASFGVRRKALEAEYDEVIRLARAEGLDVTDLEAEKLRRLAALNYQYHEQMSKIKKEEGMTWKEQADDELKQLEAKHAAGLLSEKAFQKAKMDIKKKYDRQYFDFYSNLSGSMFSAIQDAEIAQSDAKFDVLIQQAKNNGEETSALEEEKENKKLEIQKKYADVNFAIKVSQIVADTAVSIMKAFADLGPIGGAIAAAMLTATGVAQAVTAKAERDKIKNMQPGSTANKADDAPKKAERVLSGYSEGGYTGDGGRYEVAGLVHKGEYVVPKPIMNNPLVMDAVGTIEAIRRNKLLSSGISTASSTGFADGGHTSSTTVALPSEFASVVKDLKSALSNIRAYVVLRDIEKAQASLDRSRAPFSRNSN